MRSATPQIGSSEYFYAEAARVREILGRRDAWNGTDNLAIRAFRAFLQVAAMTTEWSSSEQTTLDGMTRDFESRLALAPKCSAWMVASGGAGARSV